MDKQLNDMCAPCSLQVVEGDNSNKNNWDFLCCLLSGLCDVFFFFFILVVDILAIAAFATALLLLLF
jgi:hypothetical protein